MEHQFHRRNHARDHNHLSLTIHRHQGGTLDHPQNLENHVALVHYQDLNLARAQDQVPDHGQALQLLGPGPDLRIAVVEVQVNQSQTDNELISIPLDIYNKRYIELIFLIINLFKFTKVCQVLVMYPANCKIYFNVTLFNLKYIDHP